MGIIMVNNIRIGWPKKAYDQRSPPLAEIVEYDEEEPNGMVSELKGVHPSTFTAADRILKPETQYIIVAAAAYAKYRGKWRWHIITECGVKVRCGKSLSKIWNKWRVHHMNKTGKKYRMGDLFHVPWMIFHTIKAVSSKGIRDMKCVPA